MNEVTETRRIPAPPSAVRDAINDVEPFVRAAGFDDVDADGETVRVANQVGVAEIELVLDVVDRPDADVVHEQREGIFAEMWTAYTVEPRADGGESAVTARTRFELDVPVVGGVLDASVVGFQRRRELRGQLDWLESVA